MAKTENVKKLQEDIENGPIIRGQMASLGCFLEFTFVNFLAPVLVAAHKVDNLDLDLEKSFENEVYESN